MGKRRKLKGRGLCFHCGGDCHRFRTICERCRCDICGHVVQLCRCNTEPKPGPNPAQGQIVKQRETS